jgi:hypothetical protein
MTAVFLFQAADRSVKFDYQAPAELFMAKRKGSARQQRLGYRRFATAAEAIRFAVEDFLQCGHSARGCRSAMSSSIVRISSAFTKEMIIRLRRRTD